MKRSIILITIPILLSMISCKQAEKKIAESPIREQAVRHVTQQIIDKNGDAFTFRAERGVRQVANLWRKQDGNIAEFEKFCLENFVVNDAELKTLFNKLSYGFEVLYGNFVKITKDLRKPVDLDLGPITQVDQIFAGYSVGAHSTEDLYSNRIAFITALNFPQYSLIEKTENGDKWSRKDWAYARMGDLFTTRIPAELIQNYSLASSNADGYISEYNILLGYLVNDKNERLFPEDLKLISHWGIRDELKSQYANKEGGLERQKMVYQVMKRIIDQSIPSEVINSKNYIWNPYSNVISKDGQVVESIAEPNIRYQQVVNLFHAISAMDKYNPTMPTYIQRQFEGNLEIPVDDVEKLFIDLVSSKEVRDLGKLIEKRLGRTLEPFDIWYDGFKARSGIPAEKLDAVVGKRFSSSNAYQKEMPEMLQSLGWSKEKANFFAEKIRIEAARGSGHAWGAEMREDVALLRARIKSSGMDYKGFNIATHEFGHCVEQTITLHDVDYYIMHGVPNTAFTEALAFVFQKRDLELLGMKESSSDNEYLMALDNLWSCYEIMGVSLVDINLWKWLYNNPKADAAQVKEAAISIAKDIWNKYFADVFGVKDEPILAIYSHMIDNPLYLSAYPIGHLIDFQLEKQLEGKQFANEVQRIFEQGRLIPQVWMKGAVGEPLSAKPTLEASAKAIEALSK
ncbi:MAG: hypothetical protein AB9846_11450 [Tenuifilaceae bacterium]